MRAVYESRDRRTSPATLSRKFGFQRTSQIILIGLALGGALLAVAVRQTIVQQRRSAAAVDHTQATLEKLQELLSAVKDAETGQRGFLLTGVDEYLRPYQAAASIINQRVSELGQLIADDPAQIRRVHDFRILLDRKMAELGETIQLRRTNGLAAALSVVQTGEGRKSMNELRRVAGELKTQEVHTLHGRMAAQQMAEAHLSVFISIAVLLYLVLLVVLFLLNIYYVRQRDHAELQIRHANDALEARVAERTREIEEKTRELEQRTSELERSNADLEAFAYAASHDLQEPLRMVSNFTGLLAHRYRGKLGDDADLYISYASDSAIRMQHLVDDLLRYSRAGTQALHIEQVSIQQVLDETLSNLEDTIRQNSAVITHDPLPQVCADRIKLVQVLQNLIANAIKFRKQDETPRVHISVQKSDAVWIFSVIDNGIGFDTKYTDRVFSMFQRLHGVGEYAGNGIGLPLAKRIIQHHNGRLWAESEIGKGSTFFFSLPA
jgi:signal transduction histidine kinase